MSLEMTKTINEIIYEKWSMFFTTFRIIDIVMRD